MDKHQLQAEFRKLLLEQEFAPGDKLENEVELAKRFGVSRSAMREVILHYCQMGLLERIKNRGTYVKRITPEKINEELSFCLSLSGFEPEELKETRLCLETAIVPLIVKRLSPRDIDALRANIAEMKANLDNSEIADRLDRDFHLLLLKVCNNRTLDLFSQVIYLLFRKQFRERFRTREAIKKTLRVHEAILEAVVAGEEDQARRLLIEHISPT